MTLMAPSSLQQRIDQWHRTGDLQALWPETDASRIRQAQATIRAVVAAQLTGHSSPPRLPADTDDQDSAVGIAAFASGTGPLIGYWIDQQLIDASPGLRPIFARHLHHGRRRIARLRQHLVPLLEALYRVQVAPILLKGLHTGAIYFPEPGTRPATDIDLLVRPEQRDTTAATLRAAGWREVRRTRWPARSEWVPAQHQQEVHSLEYDHVDNPWNLDLHTSLDRWYFRGLRAGLGAEGFDTATQLALQGERVAVLGQPHLTAFLALHASYELVRMQLIRLVELALVIRRDRASGALRWEDLYALLERTGTTRFACPALALVERLVPGTVDPDLLHRGAQLQTPRLKRVIDAVDAADLGPLTYRSLDDRLMWARGPWQLLLNLTEWVWPSDDAMPVSILRLHWRRLRALTRGAWGLRAASRGSP